MSQDKRAARKHRKGLKRLRKRRAQYANKRAGRTENGSELSHFGRETTRPRY